MNRLKLGTSGAGFPGSTDTGRFEERISPGKRLIQKPDMKPVSWKLPPKSSVSALRRSAKRLGAISSIGLSGWTCRIMFIPLATEMPWAAAYQSSKSTQRKICWGGSLGNRLGAVEEKYTREPHGWPPVQAAVAR